MKSNENAKINKYINEIKKKKKGEIKENGESSKRSYPVNKRKEIQLESKDKPYKIDLDLIKKSRNSFEKDNPYIIINDELNTYGNNVNKLKNNININNLKIINNKAKNKRSQRDCEISRPC